MKTKQITRTRGTVRSLGGALLLGLGLSAHAAVTVDAENFVVRQLWPWSANVVAEFVTTGTVTAPGATATLKAYDGETYLCDIPHDATTGDTVIRTTGLKRITIDPTKVPALAARGRISNFRLAVSYTDGTLDFASAGVLYVVFDLEKTAGDAGFVTALTESDLTGGSTAREGIGPYGAWKRQYWSAGANTVAWLGVAEDEAYKTTKLVLRHIPAQTFTMGSPTTEPGRLPNESYNDYNVSGSSACQVKTFGLEDAHAVTLSGYYLGVFELTQKQWELCGNAARAKVWGTTGDAVPANTITVAEIRGSGAPSEAVGADSFMGKLAATVGDGWTFDLPTEAQWEAACRAGTATGLYDGTELPTDLAYYTQGTVVNMYEITYEPLDNLAVFFNGKKDVPVTTVGTKLPNNYGLYDMLGNAGELCRDRIEANKGLGTAATANPLSVKGGICLRGGSSDNYLTYNYGLAPFRAAARAVVAKDADAVRRQFGFRVQMTPTAVASETATETPTAVASCRVDTGAGTTLLSRTLGGGAVTLAWELPDDAATTRLTLTTARTSQELTFAAGVTSYVWTVSAPTDETNERAYTLTLTFEKDGAPLAGTELVATGIGVVRGVGASGATRVYANGTANRRWHRIHGAEHATVPLLREDITSLAVDGATQAIAVPGWYDLAVSYGTSRTLSLVTPTDTTDVTLTARPAGTLLLIR